MDRVASISLRAASLYRRIFASLPWGFRVAWLLERLASDYIEAFGRAIYAEFLKLRMEGMPPIHGKDPYEAINVNLPRLADRLPHGYGEDFARKSWKILLRKFKSEESIKESMGDFLLSFLGGGATHVDPSLGLKSAENFVLKSLINSILNYIKHHGYSRSMTVEDEEGGGYVEMDVLDPSAFKKFEEILPPWEMSKVKEDLLKVHPDAPLYIDFMMEGYEGKEIVNGGMLPHWVDEKGEQKSYAGWHKVVLPKILAVLRKHVEGFRETESRKHPE